MTCASESFVCCDRWDDLASEIHQQAMELLPEHVYIDNGHEETLRSAFLKYRFCGSTF